MIVAERSLAVQEPAVAVAAMSFQMGCFSFELEVTVIAVLLVVPMGCSV